MIDTLNMSHIEVMNQPILRIAMACSKWKIYDFTFFFFLELKLRSNSDRR